MSIDCVEFSMPWHVKLMTMKRKKASTITLQEHLESIASLGGHARAERLSAKEQSEIGRKAGLVGGRARAHKLTPKQRQEIAKKAAAARCGKPKKSTAGALKGVRVEARPTAFRKASRESSDEPSI
jgi:hypothetical protein